MGGGANVRAAEKWFGHWTSITRLLFA